MFKNAIVRKPCPAMVNGISEANLGLPDFQKALLQHQNYVEALKNCGLNVIVLEESPLFPDSTFVEDVSLCTPHCAIITNPGAASRKAEILGMKEVLSPFYHQVESISGAGTLDGGDVMMVGEHYYIGISDRTNEEGAAQLIAILQKYKLKGSKVPLHTMLHLKTGLSYLEKNNLLVSGEFVGHPAFATFNQIVIEEEEQYAANSLWINGKVIVPLGHPNTKSKIEALGYEVLDVDVSEFQKLDGGLSCLSLRF